MTQTAAQPAIDAADPRVITFPTGARAEFPFPVGTLVYIDDAAEQPDAVAVVVRLKVPSGARLNENVFGVRRDGLIAWQIPARLHVYDESPYMDLSVDGDAVVCGNWDGEDVRLDPATGAVLGTRFTK